MAVLLGQGMKVAEVIKALDVVVMTYGRWRQHFGGMTIVRAKRDGVMAPCGRFLYPCPVSYHPFRRFPYVRPTAPFPHRQSARLAPPVAV